MIATQFGAARIANGTQARNGTLARDLLPVPCPIGLGPMHLRLLELDGSLDWQTALPACALWRSTTRVPLRDLAPALRLWSSRRAIEAARARLPAPGVPSVTLIGSGDFHHLTALLLASVAVDVTLVHFDNHPDWVWAAPRWHCGGWINRALELPHVARVVTIGPCSADLERPELRGGNVGALARGDIVMFPSRRPPSRVLRRVPDGPGHRRDAGRLVWRNLADETDTEARWTAVIAAIPTDGIWISIDKDVLAPDAAATNWDQGEMPLAALLEGIAALGRAKRLVGADICGDYSPLRHRNWLKRWEARRDQPRAAVDRATLARNERTNVALLRALHRIAA